MNRKVLYLFFVMIIAALTCYTVTAAMSEFSADFTSTDAKGKIATGKTFIKNNKIRQEITTEGETAISILRMDQKVSWTLMPANKQYMEMAIPFDPSHPSNEAGTEYEYEMKTIGHETINGYDCEVIQYTYKKKKYGILVQWIATKLNFAIKYQNKDSNGKVTSTMEYKNIKIGGIADSLFEIPAGYTKFSMDFKIPGMK
jgi:outer membrane lipoprotein-sorting protein